MILTKDIAKKHVGKYIDSYKRLFGHYPMKIIVLPDGVIGLKDATDTITRIEDTGSNVRHYDYMFSMIESGGVEHAAD